VLYSAGAPIGFQPLQPVSNEGYMRLEVRGIDHGKFLFIAHRERLISELIDALGAGRDVVPDGLAAGPYRFFFRLARAIGFQPVMIMLEMVTVHGPFPG
jgi:hypothetical protein